MAQGGKVIALVSEEFTLVGSHKITATDLLDQYMVWRLKDIIEDCSSFGELEDITLSCRVLLRFMGESID